MPNWVELTAKDEHRLQMYQAIPEGTPKGAIVVLQEIFGVNAHIRSVCDRLAGAGYVAGAPALFDRLSPGYEAGYEPEEVSRSKAFLQTFDFDRALDDIDAAVAHLETRGPVSIVGFCLGGSLAYKMATVSDRLACAVGYYGGRIPDYADQAPRCPVILHFGEQDASIPMDKVEIVRQKQPDLPIYTYPAGHGFNCDRRGSYEPESARVAWERTMALVDEVSGGA